MAEKKVNEKFCNERTNNIINRLEELKQLDEARWDKLMNNELFHINQFVLEIKEDLIIIKDWISDNEKLKEKNVAFKQWIIPILLTIVFTIINYFI